MCNRILLLLRKLPQWNININCHVNGTEMEIVSYHYWKANNFFYSWKKKSNLFQPKFLVFYICFGESEAVVQRCSQKFRKIHRKTPCLIFNKVGLRPATLLKMRLLWILFSCEFCEISRNTFFHRAPLVAALESISAEAKKIPVLESAHFRKSQLRDEKSFSKILRLYFVQ